VNETANPSVVTTPTSSPPSSNASDDEVEGDSADQHTRAEAHHQPDQAQRDAEQERDDDLP
jgi:hypothetical protein